MKLHPNTSHGGSEDTEAIALAWLQFNKSCSNWRINLLHNQGPYVLVGDDFVFKINDSSVSFEQGTELFRPCSDIDKQFIEDLMNCKGAIDISTRRAHAIIEWHAANRSPDSYPISAE